MARTYALGGLRRVSRTTRQGRPLCSCATPVGARLYSYIGCPKCHGTGGDGAPTNAAVGPEATSSLTGGG